ncbi:MAG: DegT/DnrJ/EryC1/StrS family aminotransferase [Methyloceanibacter sp.]|uniref:DegT/DnrJ/EryC1/StrS family aminotransferase n=1 Tax=Methyloceanibacter sp. TaxID=1965321 RepID=UPI003D6D5BB6
MSKDTKRTIPAFIDLAAQRQRMGDRIGRALLDVLESDQYILGPQVAEVERRLAVFCGAKHCISCANGTDALLLALMAENVGPGDAVFVPAFTFVATAEVPVLSGATPVFVDVRRDTFNMDTDSLEGAIGAAKARGLTPRCIIAVDLYGQPADYARIHDIAAAHGLLVIADAAQSFGAALSGKKVGTLAAYTGTSFYPSKPLGAYGDGGALFTDDDAKAKLLLSLRNHGKGPSQTETEEIGLNSRLDSFQAAVLLEKLGLFPAEIVARQAAAQRYNAALAAVAKVPELMAGTTSVWAQYTIITDRRDAVANACRAAGVPTAIHYTSPLHQLAPYRDYPTASGGLPNAEWLVDRVISLPMHGYLSHEAQDLVIDTVLGALGTVRKNIAAE